MTGAAEQGGARERPLVTIAIPLYKRLDFLPGVLGSVAGQDYPAIELLVSDNGENDPGLRDLVARHYEGPFTFRRNATTVPMSVHFNQLVESAAGEYFVLLCDDDEIRPGFVSSLVSALQEGPEIGVAIPLVELMAEDGGTLSAEEVSALPYAMADPDRLPPDKMTGTEFVRLWVDGSGRFTSFVTTMARTGDILAAGGYPTIPTGDDDAVVLRLALGRKVAYCKDAVFRLRAYEASEGLAMSPWELAADIKSWLEFLDSDPFLQRYSAEHPTEWAEVRALMRAKAWRTYRHRWKTMYRRRMGLFSWLRAGFALPYIPEYYRWLARYLVRLGLSSTKRVIRA